MVLQLIKRLFTVTDYHRMADAGIFSEDDRVELIEGEIIDMTPIGSRHAACVGRLTALFYPVRERSIVWVQNPIHLGERSEPQPDLALLRLRHDFYATALPTPEDVLLVVEVAESSIMVDREVKVPLYARAGVPEVWVVNLAAMHIEVSRNPTAHGYQEIQHLVHGQQVFPQAFPDLHLNVDDILA